MKPETHEIQNSIVKINGISRVFGAFTALDNISLNINRGEQVVICGPSGSGKSTLVRTLNGLETIDSGSIEINGITLENKEKILNKIRLHVGMVFQSFNLFPHLNILENLILAPMKVKGIVRKEAEEIAYNLLKRVHISEQALKYPASLSGGQQQRVAIARALAMAPEILLFDEPTSALDPEMVGEVLEVIKELAQSGQTLICVTHEMNFARAVASRIIFMEKGKIYSDQKPDSFFDEENDPRIKAFLGRINH